ncbi:hypothetical protein HJC23_003028 [Cyclotella cryptica]|uniref:Uncharacterized protein n=1 Tax=Cyclotella cryptica TaxID=29204 RepID=A0ABD3Q427_9STRA|eukprot:CCRYP_010186-RA/>CCRYP_010186-RA protein AED:0.04 eAED:0.04 QI:0/-1/0/1/-1/1/1/0/924
MSEPPAENLSISHRDPPSKSASSLDQHFAKHRQEPSIPINEAASSPRPDATSTASRNISSGASYNASLHYGGGGGDAPSVGDSVYSGDDFTVRSDTDGGGGDSVISYNASREAAPGEEETARLLRGGSRSAFPNPYRKRQQQQQSRQQGAGARQQGANRVSFAEQLFGKTYDSNSSVVASVVGSISGTVATAGPGVRRKVPRVGSNSSYASSSSSSSTVVSSSSEGMSSLTSALFSKRLHKFNSIKKNATLLSVLTMGVMIFIGASLSISEIPNETTAEGSIRLEEEARGLGYEHDTNAQSASGLGIMDNIHPPLQAGVPILPAGSSASHASSQSDPQSASSQQVDWNKVPPHLRGYYSKTFGPPPSSEGGGGGNIFDPAYGPNNSYSGQQQRQDVLESEYEKSQFANAQAAMAIQSIGKEAVLGFRPMTGRDYHAQGDLNKELTSAGMGTSVVENGGFQSDGSGGGGGGGGGGFSGPMLKKEDFVMQEEQQLRGQQQQRKNDPPMDSEEQKRLAAQEAALSKASTAEDDARKKREEEVVRLRASAGLTGYYYPQKEGTSSAAVVPAVGANVDDTEKQEEQAAAAAVAAAAEEDVKQKLELVRQRMKEEAEATQKKEEEARQKAEDEARKRAEDDARQQNAEAEAKQKLEEEARQRNENEARQQEESRQREEEAARQQEMARQEAAEEAAKQKLEMLRQQKAEEERQKNSQPSLAQELLKKYLNVPFREQTKSEQGNEESVPPLPPPQPLSDKQPDLVPSAPQQTQEQNQPFDKPAQDIPNEQQPVQHDQPQQQEKQEPPGQTHNKSEPEAPKQQQPPQQQGQSPPHQPAQLRIQVENGQLSFDDWRSKMKQKLHNQIQEESKKNAPPPPPPPSQAEIKDKVSQKMEQVEQAQSAIMKGESTDLDSIASLQKELSELLALMGGT